MIASFGQYGRGFQEKILQALLSDRPWAEQMLEVFNVEYFDVKYLAFLADRYFGHAKKYKVFPTLQLLVTIIRDELKTGTDVILRDQIIDYLTRMRSNPNPGDLQYVKEKTLDFCRKQALKHALEVAVDQIQANKYEQIVEGIKKAVCVGTTPALGHDFFHDYEARFTRLQRNCVATGIDELDCRDILNGGLGSGEIGVIVAPTGVGKSHMLTFLGANALRNGIDVLHYTMELSETAVGRRYDSNLCNIDSNDVIEGKDAIISQYKGMKLGRLMIKEFPTSTATIYTLRSHIERLDLKGFRPGLIIIDYADIMRSTRRYDSLRHELKLIYEELRGFAGEKLLPIWTACFHGDTVISSPSGDFKIKDKVGQSSFPVYSYNHKTKRLELRTVNSVYRSGTNVEVWRVTLGNGEHVIVTPTHKFMKRDGSYSELCDLRIGDSLMPFEKRTSVGSMPGRAQVYRNDGTWEFVYKMVAEWKFGSIPKLHQVHHVDLDKKNDHPDNLELLTISEHHKVHARNQWDSHVPCSLDHLRETFYVPLSASTALKASLKRQIWRRKNHVIVKIEPWGRADVYNMEVDDLHNYALASGVIVKNSQSNKEGANSDIVDLGNMAEAYGKAMVADVVLSISRNVHEKSDGYGRLFIAKNRAGRDGIVYPVKIDTARSKFEISGSPRNPEETAREDERGFKRALAAKWREVQADAVLQKPNVDGSTEPKGSGE